MKMGAHNTHFGGERGVSVLSFLPFIRRGLGCPSSAEVIKDTEDFIQFDGLYSLFSAVERFLYLRDFLNYFCFIDFFI